MSKCLLFRVKGDKRTYLADIGAGTVTPVESKGVDLAMTEGCEPFQEVEFAVASEARASTASFPFFTDV